MKKRRIFLSLLICIAAAFFACGIFAISNTKDRGQTVTAQAETAITPTIYWGISGSSNNRTLTLSNSQVTGVASGSFSGTEQFDLDNCTPWYNSDYYYEITTVNIATKIVPQYTDLWFYSLENLQYFQNFDNLDMSKVKSILRMFHTCTNLTTVDVSNWDLSNCEIIGLAFYNCHSLTYVDVSNWDTSQVKNMNSMFFNCASLKSVDVSNWNVSLSASIRSLFNGCTSLEAVDLSNVIISESLINLSYMFNGTTGLKKLKLSDTLAEKISTLAGTDDGDTGLSFPLYYQDGTKINSASEMIKGGGYFKTKHTHDYQLTSTTPATCLEDGEKISTCSEEFCTDVKTETIPKINGEHTWGAWVDKTAATCTADKVQERICSACGDKQTQTVAGTKLGHLYGNPVWEWADDYSTATAKFTCTHEGCGYLHSLPATVTQTPTAATCMAKGKITYNATLAVNGAEFSQSSYTASQEKETDKLNHIAATTWSKDSTNHWHACTLNCGTKLDEVAHTFDIWKVDTPATVTTTGMGHYECTCGERGADEVIPVETCAHPNKTHVAAVAATCAAQGNPEYWTCGDCGKNLDSTNVEIATIVIPIDPNNHVAWGVWQTETAATCIATGTEKRICADCSHEETRDIAIDPNNHDLEHHDGQAPTCTEAGWNAYDTCTRCTYTTYSEIAATGHSEVTDEAVAPTCTKTGLTAGTHCSVCGEVLTVQEEVPALGHNYEWVITKEATIEEAGLMENLCTVCQNKDGEQVIDKLEDPNGNGEIDLPVDVHVEFKVTQSSTDNDYADIDKGLKRGYWAQLWYRNDDGTLGDEFVDKINCFLTLKIPTDIIEAIRGGEEINRDKIAAGLKVFYIDGEGLPVEVNNFTIAMRDDDSWQIKFNYNEKFRAEVVFAADLADQPTPEPESGIPWWVWLIVGISVVVIIILIVVIALAAKNKKNGGGGSQYDDAELKAQLAEQGEKIDELLERDDGGFNTPVELDENGNVIFK